MKEKDEAKKYLELGKQEYKERKYIACIRSLTYAEQLFAALNDKELEGECLIYIANSYIKLGQLDKGIKAYEEAIFKFEGKNTSKKGTCEYLLGLIYRDNKNNISKAKEYLTRAINSFEFVNNLEKQADALRALAIARIKNPRKFVEKKEEIISNFTNALKLFQSVNVKEKMAVTSLELGEFLISLEKYADSLKYLEQAYNYYKSGKSERILFTLRIDLIQSHLLAGNKNAALRYYKEAIEQSKRGYFSEKLEKFSRFF
ncbi:MAG: tetratricopeptide repeat protein [Candidatus Heimdallarchaeum aukensis]|uniref:Tetratricopeptide repeat protein n=1 Tax=Candidatus Heimdallarchaeum aukensis TaxID=2876573 RepID=A0A9Y1BKQ6_9ARCH|nr:MAG: tetratricopeptide repeat protein [Candidatus Heimdallarchaeum aukensis]